MRTSRAEALSPSAVRARIIEDAVVIDLSDGRTLTAPLAWYPRLLHGTARERRRWRLIGGGEGVHWPDLDEDLSVEGLLAGRPSAESQASFKRWLEGRRPRANKLRLSVARTEARRRQQRAAPRQKPGLN
jgi:hypothetical protein